MMIVLEMPFKFDMPVVYLISVSKPWFNVTHLSHIFLTIFIYSSIASLKLLGKHLFRFCVYKML